MTWQALALLVVLMAAGAAALLSFLRKRQRRVSEGAAADSPGEIAAGQGCHERPACESTGSPSASFPLIEGTTGEPEAAPDRHDESVVPLYPGSRMTEEAQYEGEQRREIEVAPTPSAQERRDVVTSEPERAPEPPPDLASTSGSIEAVPHSAARTSSQGGANSILAEHQDEATVERTRVGGSDIVPEQHEGMPSEGQSRTAEVSVYTDDSEETSVSNTVPEDQEAVGQIHVGQKVEAPEEPQLTGALLNTGTAPEANPPVEAPDQEDAPLTLPDEEAAGETGLEEQAEDDAVPPSLDKPRRQKRKARNKKPRKYEGLARNAPQPREAKQEGRRSDSEGPPARDRSLPLEVRLRFDRGGFCRLSLIARRSNGLPEDITVWTHSGDLELQAIQDEWYQDVSTDDIARVLDDGVVWTQKDASEPLTWSLSGRPLYVLAARADISGFVSQPCLELDRDHVVLCRAAIRSEVEVAIKKTGATPTSILDESLGLPQGWIVFRGVVPRTPVTPASGADLFNALRPLPRIEISTEGGIRLEHATWLEGYPPLIKIYGDPEHTAKVLIDGNDAERGEDGCFRAPAWDSIGSHLIWCSGASKSYSVVPFASTWEAWDAYAFPVSYGAKRRIAICGPLFRCASDDVQSPFVSVTVPEANPILLGRAPGQLVIAESASGLRGTLLIASPPFSPVWALPREPLHCDKKETRVLLVGDLASPDATFGNPTQRGVLGNRPIEAWCRFILDAGRKGIRTDPDTEDVQSLWLQYKRVARRIWRGRK